MANLSKMTKAQLINLAENRELKILDLENQVAYQELVNKSCREETLNHQEILRVEKHKYNQLYVNVQAFRMRSLWDRIAGVWNEKALKHSFDESIY